MKIKLLSTIAVALLTISRAFGDGGGGFQATQHVITYKSVAGKEPNAENMLASLDSIENAEGARAGELLASIYLLSQAYGDKPVLVSKIKTSMSKNRYWLVQVTAAESIYSLDVNEGVLISQRVLDNPDIPIEGKLRLAHYLAKRNCLIGYPILRDSLVRLKMTFELYAEFKKHEGEKWDDAGSIIDLAPLEKVIPKLIK